MSELWTTGQSCWGFLEVIFEAKFGKIFAYGGFIFIHVEEQRYCLVFLVYW